MTTSLQLDVIYRFLGYEPGCEKPPTLEQVRDGAMAVSLIRAEGNVTAAAAALGCSKGRIVDFLNPRAKKRRMAVGMVLSLCVVGLVNAQIPALPALAVAPKTNGVVTLAWTRSPDPSVTGYRVYIAPSNSTAWVSYLVGNADGAALGQLTVGTAYKANVTATDGSIESAPSNEVTFIAEAASANIVTTIRILTFAIESKGVFARTNALQESTNTTTWTDALVFVGDGNSRGIVRTNFSNRFYRTVVK